VKKSRSAKAFPIVAIGASAGGLKSANNDFSNLLANIGIPIILLDSALVIRYLTPSAGKALDLAQDKIGRSILSVNLPMHLPGLKEILKSVIKTGRVQSREVLDTDGRCYYLIVRPYRTERSKSVKSRIEGAVLSFIDMQERKSAEKAVARLAAVARDSYDSVIILDLKDRVTAWNRGAQKMYGYTEAQALGMSIRKLMPGNMRMKALDLVQKTAAPIETQRRTRSGRILDVLITVTVLRDAKGHPVEVATTERDITELKHADREFRRLHASVISAQETERKRLARELHDGVGQILSGVKFRLQALPGSMVLSDDGEAKIAKVGGFLDYAIAEIRRVSQNLMPAELVDLGLAPALLTLCREFKERSGVRVTVRDEGIPPGLSPDLALALFRITQEALNNIGKHSRATMAGVNLSLKGKTLVLSVSDNGVGFKLNGQRQSSGRGFGLGNMRQRAESIGGLIELRSTPGVGTTLNVHAPLPV
jgi:PAS domain S-box-containing protein